MSKKTSFLNMINFDPKQPFNALPRLPPPKRLESRAVLKKCIEARSALAELKVQSQMPPNPAILINTLPLLEAKDSSEIENIVTTADALFKHASCIHDQNHVSNATQEAFFYRTALYKGFKSLSYRPLCVRTAIEVCSIIKESVIDIRKIPGTALTNSKGVIYTPPVGQNLLYDLLTNWENFLYDQTCFDPLVRLAIAHYQFEAIHPFHDGNGRCGRIINQLFLVQFGLLTLPILYLSRYILNHKNDYYRLLLGVTRNASWESWILYMLDAVEQTAYWTIKKIVAIQKLYHHTIWYLRQQLPKIYSRELVDILFTQPYCRVAYLVDNKIVKRQTSAVYLNQLCTASVLKKQQIGKEHIFIHVKLMQLLTGDDEKFTKYSF